MTDDRLTAAADRGEILDLAMRAMIYRDRGDWDALLDCFHSDARLVTSWFEGNAHQFIEQSRAMMQGHDSGDSQKHIAANPTVAIEGDRALCECYLTLHQRRRIEGYLFDFQTWSSVLDIHEKRNGAWRILGRWMIYEKDRMDPHKPSEVPAEFFEKMDLAPYPDALKYHCWRNAQSSGHHPSKDLHIEGSERAAESRAAARKWLEGGPLPWADDV